MIYAEYLSSKCYIDVKLPQEVRVDNGYYVSPKENMDIMLSFSTKTRFKIIIIKIRKVVVFYRCLYLIISIVMFRRSLKTNMAHLY